MNRYFWETASRLLLLLTFLPLYSCTNSFYHVGTLQSEQVKVVDEDFVFENEHLKVIYNFWENGGRMRYLLFNKTNQPIYIDWTNSFMVNKEVKTTYSQLASLSKSASVDTFKYVYKHNRLEPLRISARISPIAPVPPEGTLAAAIADFSLQQTVLHPNTTDTLFVYSAENTPVRVMHQICYSFNEALTDLHQIDHSFWVNNIRVIRQGKLVRVYGSAKMGPSNAYYVKEKRLAPLQTIALLFGTVGVPIGLMIHAMSHWHLQWDGSWVNGQ